MRIALLLLTAIIVSSCAAKDRYTNYVPPPGASGKVCTDECERLRKRCINYINLRHEQCLKLQRMEEQRRRDCQRAMGNLPGGCIPARFCTLPDFSECEADYGSCWRTCGGEVEFIFIDETEGTTR